MAARLWTRPYALRKMGSRSCDALAWTKKGIPSAKAEVDVRQGGGAQRQGCSQREARRWRFRPGWDMEAGMHAEGSTEAGD